MILIAIDCGFHIEEMAEREEQIKQFCELTGEPEDRAKFFLEASGWNNQVSNGVSFLYWSELNIQMAHDTYFEQKSSDKV